jgi:hypothetical protein
MRRRNNTWQGGLFVAANVTISTVYTPSDEVVAREIEGELIIVPLTAGVGDMEEALFTFNETGRAIWDRLDGQRSLRDVALELADLYEAPLNEIEPDVTGLVGELVSRRMLVEISSG